MLDVTPSLASIGSLNKSVGSANSGAGPGMLNSWRATAAMVSYLTWQKVNFHSQEKTWDSTDMLGLVRSLILLSFHTVE